MTVPSWQDEKLGTMKRAALWLVQTVGEGNTFTKTGLRDAFPRVSQIDRRMRDLRGFGWRIDTSREDLTLGPHEQRFVQRGSAVWEAGKATKSATASLTATQRRELLVRDGHMCRSCGISAGQPYAGGYEAAQLDVARREVVLADGTKRVQLAIECNRCRVGGRGLTSDLRETLARIDRLPTFDRRMLAQWIEKDERAFSEAEALWAEYRALPAEAREQIRAALS